MRITRFTGGNTALSFNVRGWHVALVKGLFYGNCFRKLLVIHAYRMPKQGYGLSLMVQTEYMVTSSAYIYLRRRRPWTKLSSGHLARWAYRTALRLSGADPWEEHEFEWGPFSTRTIWADHGTYYTFDMRLWRYHHQSDDI